ncbi:DoxX family protein [Paenibacillus sp. HWE-109]|uniref:DoxX family protein n=1 Tax=Paenibacillus sp. HWE-109 TaxID=1306526 RepID=UPI001EDD507B|nr:DoxX family protein [Paenibacillus sp. HWE-109]UKS25404.1 DoxX family protein [Paenibacillus sp. HWE-109]
MKWVVRILQALLALGYLMFGFMKLSGDPMQVEAFTTTYGYGEGFMYVVGAIELLAAIGLIIGFWKPRIAFVSAGVIVITMAGAVITHLKSGQGMGVATMPLILLIVALIIVIGRSRRA